MNSANRFASRCGIYTPFSGVVGRAAIQAPKVVVLKGSWGSVAFHAQYTRSEAASWPMLVLAHKYVGIGVVVVVVGPVVDVVAVLVSVVVVVSVVVEVVVYAQAAYPSNAEPIRS